MKEKILGRFWIVEKKIYGYKRLLNTFMIIVKSVKKD